MNASEAVEVVSPSGDAGGPPPAAVETTVVSASPPAPWHRRRRWPWVVGLFAAIALGASFVVPAIRTAMTTVSTDDA